MTTPCVVLVFPVLCFTEIITVGLHSAPVACCKSTMLVLVRTTSSIQTSQYSSLFVVQQSFINDTPYWAMVGQGGDLTMQNTPTVGHSWRGCDISHWSRECLQKFNIRVVLKSGQTWSPLNVDQVKNTPCTLNNPMWYHLQLWRSLYWKHEVKSRDKNVLRWLQEGGMSILETQNAWRLEMRLKKHWDACPLQI